MTAIIAAYVLLTATGAAPALALTRSLPYMLALGPIAGALQFWVAAQVALVAGIGWTPAALFVATLANAYAIGALWHRRSGADDGRRWRTIGWDTGLVALVASIVPWTMIRRAPVDWDARSIWFFQAEWLAGGGPSADDALANPAFVFAHPDYPKLGPAAMAAVWRTFDSRSVEVAQATVSVLMVAAVVAVGVTIGVGLEHVIGHGRHRRRNLLVATGLFSIAFYGAARSWTFNGYMDGLWAALLVGGFAATIGCVNDRTFAAGIVMLSAAVCTKNEALVPVVVVAVVIGLHNRRRPRRAVAGSVPIVFAFVWLVIRRALDVPSTYGSGQFRGILSGVSVDRVTGITEAIGVFVALPALAFAAVALLGGSRLRRRRSELGLSPIETTVIVAAASLASLVAALMIVNPDRYRPIAERTTIAAVGLLLFDLFLSLVVAADLRARSADEHADDDVAEPATEPLPSS